MKRWVRWLSIGGAVALAAGGGYWFGSRVGSGSGSDGSGNGDGNASASSQAGPVVPVSTASIVRKRITETATAYGRILAEPGAVDTISLPYEAIVNHVLVTPGQPVRAGTVLVRVEPSPATRLQLEQARAALSAAQRNLQQVRQEYDQHLAITNQLISAEKSADTARLQVSQLEKEGGGQAHAITARHAGVVAQVPAHDGQAAPAGTPLVAIAIGSRFEAELGVEPEDASYVHVGDPIRIAPVNAVNPDVVTGHVRVVGRESDPKTQLINVVVALPDTRRFSLSSFVEGKFTTGSDVGLVVPREALLPKGGQYKLFTIVDGKADEHVVETGLETDQEVEIKGGDLHAGEPVVIQGNYELSTGTSVSTGTSEATGGGQ